MGQINGHDVFTSFAAPSGFWCDDAAAAMASQSASCISGTLCQTAATAGIELSLPALLAELFDIREVALLYSAGTLRSRKDHVTLSRVSARQRKLAQTLDIASVLPG
jgi:hypothetical protein